MNVQTPLESSVSTPCSNSVQTLERQPWFNGTTKAAWYAPISEKSESVEAWLEEMGWEVINKDLRSTDVED